MSNSCPEKINKAAEDVRIISDSADFCQLYYFRTLLVGIPCDELPRQREREREREREE